VAERLSPLGRSKPIVLDPDRGFGEPTVPSVGVTIGLRYSLSWSVLGKNLAV
jgi:hypothetical protein